MNILTVDFETYYDSEYSLRKMTMIEYIMDGRFQPIMMSYKLNDGKTHNAVGFPRIKAVLDSIDWGNTVLNAQNTSFDATIIRARFGHTARYYTDTMAMARVTGAHIFQGASLDAIAQVLRNNGVNVPPKGKEVHSAAGYRLYDIYTSHPYLAKEATTDSQIKQQGFEMLQRYIEYCNNDVELAFEAFKYFTPMISKEEINYGDMILKCYIEPSMYLDLGIIQAEIERIEQRDKDAIEVISWRYFGGDSKLMKETMRSAPKFTEFLKGLGGVLEYEWDGQSPYEFFIPYKYSEKKGRNEPCYTKTHVPVIEMLEHPNQDLADIFRMKLAMTSSIEMSRAKRFESIAKLGVGFGMPYTVSGAHTHRLGGCLAENTIVLVQPQKGRWKGKAIEKYIQDVAKTDLVWDGIEFVSHDGVVFSGVKSCKFYRREIGGKIQPFLIGTSEHKVMVDGEWLPLEDVQRRKTFIDTAFYDGEIAKEIRWSKSYKFNKPYNLHATYDIVNCGPRTRFVANGYIVHNSGGLNVQNLSSGRRAGQSNALKRSITAPDGYKVVVQDSSQVECRVTAYVANDVPYLQVFVNKQDPYSVMASQIYGGDPNEIKRLAKADVEPYCNIQRPAGKALVLGAGFGTGPAAFMNYAKQMGVELELEEAKRLIQIYRQSHPDIVRLWKRCDAILSLMIAEQSGYFGGPKDDLFFFDGSREIHGVRVPGIRLPDGMWLNYAGLKVVKRQFPDGSVKDCYCYWGIKEGKAKWIYTYGARVTENIVQSFAFAVMKYQALLINKKYRIVLNTHDEWGIVVRDEEVRDAQAYMEECMRTPPPWAEGLPLDCEGSSAQHYGDCK